MRTLLVALALGGVLLAACSGDNDTDRDGAPADTPSASATTAGESPANTAEATTTPAETGDSRASGTPDHDGDRAFAHVEALAEEIGIRVSGTAAEIETVDYIRGELESYGYTVEVMEFTFGAAAFRPGAVEVAGEAIEALALQGTATGTVSGPGVYVGAGDSEAIAGRDLTGAIAIAERDDILFRDKYGIAHQAGAIALIVLNAPDRRYAGGNLLGQAETPAVMVPADSAERLREAAANGETVTVEVAPGDETPAHNVIARPADGAECRILVGGHHDTVPGAPGANDNASGTANVLELARAFAADGLDDGLCFATFGAEESGLFGSTELALRWNADDLLPAVMVNLDVTGGSDTVEIIGSPEMIALALEEAEVTGIAARESSLPPNTGSDHQSFASQGVPVVFFTSGAFGEIHSPDDTLDTVTAQSLDLVGDLAYATIVALLAELAAPEGAA